MAAVIPALAKATVFGVVFGAGAASMLPYNASHARGPVFMMIAVASVALRAMAWYFGITAAVCAAGGIILSMYIQDNNTSHESMVGGALFGGAIGYLLEQGVLGLAR